MSNDEKPATAPRRKLDERGVLDIRRRLATGELAAVLATDYGVSVSYVRAIGRGAAWASVGGPRTTPRRHPRLDEEAVLDIRRRMAGGEKPAVLAAEHGVSADHVRQVSHGHTWTDVGGPCTTPRQSGKLDEQSVLDIRRRLAEGEQQAALAAEHGVNPANVHRVACGDIWADVGGPRITPRKRTRLDEAAVIDIRRRMAGGERAAVLAAEYGIIESYVYQIALGNKRADVGGPRIASRRVVKLDEAAIIDIRERRAAGETTAILATEYGVDQSYIGMISRGDKRADVGGPRTTPERRTRLNEAAVVDVRERCAAGERIGDLAREYGASYAAVRIIVRGRTWRQVGGPRTIPQGRTRLDERDVLDIRERCAAGERIGDLAREYGVSHKTVRSIVLGRTWKQVGGPLSRP